ncbi:ATP-binding protein [Priestia flexa]|uniref:histidine kinase n=2 Tax=Priestia flexa TaxID=86664 RepID=A0ABU4JBS1_9BACI|nr:ATP-binding protein [Priestia flexa]MBY6087647.1 HAMP domain-containing histidine kinase [Priestia flexa]MCA1201279.1 HAMP domain-containing histidine kinase [Priestia flexa]MCG7312390.1 HAMP domain-containing histidine kinase [Priestia flexa]MDW8518453.1 ATP-binding protein [Priestia flexa]MED4591056.1 ATP-binding protein [Priestia flexa]
MTKKLIRRARNRMKQDLFSKTQNRLTFRYSALLMIFLLLFVFIVYSLVYVVISSNQQQSLNMLLKQETKFVKSLLVEQNDQVEDEYQDIVVAREDAFFYYVVSPEGQLLMGSEASEGLRPKLLNLINGWIPIENEVRKERIETIRPNVEKFERNGHAEDEFKVSIDLLMTGQPIFYKGEFLGMLYIGKNVSFLYQLLKWLLVIMLSLTVLFVGVAIYMSRLMSKRAMIPIETAFLKQKEFVADASHELRTPLSVMLSSINALEMQDEVNEDPFSKKLVGNMKAEVKRMTKLVSDLLTLARSDASKNQQAFNKFDIKKMVEKVMQSVEPLAHSKNISLHLEAPDQIELSGDEEKLTQLMYILLDNGIKYTTPQGHVKVLIKQRPNAVEIRVADTGVGIHKDEQKRIFDRFYRADKSRSRQMGGHGLGLAIAKWIVDMHKGTIKVESEPEKGTTFRISLPQ